VVPRHDSGGLTLVIHASAVEPCAPWPRHVLAPQDWARLPDEPGLTLLALWADTVQVYALLRTEADGAPLLVSTAVEGGAYPALSRAWPLAARFERMVRDLWGHTASDGFDQRPFVDHGRWPHTAPMALSPGPPSGASEPPEFASEEGLDQIPVGPIRGDLEPAAHLRLIGRGETIVRLEARLGYAHKGTLSLMRGKSPRAAARFAARLSGEATVAHSIAFARATEAASNCEAPARAVALRGVMAEIERIASHLAALASIAEAAGVAALSSRCARHEEAMHRAAEIAFGHRLMMDCVVPGGVAAEIAPDGAAAIGRALAGLAGELPGLESLPVAHLSGMGLVTPEQATRFAASGVIGRGGDAEARARLRLAAIDESLRLLRILLNDVPGGEVSMPLPTVSGEGIGFAAGPSGDVWHWLRLDHGQIAAVFARDPAWAHWCLLEAIMADGQAEQLPLILASFGLGSSGVDM
jgi:Ni,Fe-hydrogenase III large subunit